MARISTNNGVTFMDIDEFDRSDYSYAWLTRSWRFIVHEMDGETRRAVCKEIAPLDADETSMFRVACNRHDFLKRYLELAADDIVVG